MKKLKEYKLGEYTQYKRDLKYWCNACGELHHFGEYDITEEELPDDLKLAYSNLWNDGLGSLCYLVTYCNKNYIALVNEYDDTFAADIGKTMDEIYLMIKHNAEKAITLPLFDDTLMLSTEYGGCDECHELITLIPPDIQESKFKEIAAWLYDNVYC